MIWSGVWMWLRRGTSTLAFPAFVVVGVVVALSRRGWEYEWNWAFSSASSGVLIIAPLLAGIVAFDRSRRVFPTLEMLANTALRGRWGDIALVLAAWIVGVAAWASTMGYAAVRTSAHHPGGTPDLWILIEVPAVMALACAVGLLVGSVMSGLMAGPVAAGVVYLARFFGDSLGVEGFMAAGGATGPLAALERDPTVGLVLVTLHLILAALAMGVAQRTTIACSPMVHRVSIGVAAVLAAAAMATAHINLAGREPYRWTTAASVCVGGPAGIEVCGPVTARATLRVAANGLSVAVTQLDTSRMDLQRHYVLPSGEPVHPSWGVLRATPDEFVDGRLGLGDIASTLSMPRLCKALFGDRPPEALLNDQSEVQSWVTNSLHSQDPAAPSQTTIEAYRHLRDCEPMTQRLP